MKIYGYVFLYCNTEISEMKALTLKFLRYFFHMENLGKLVVSMEKEWYTEENKVRLIKYFREEQSWVKMQL